MTKNVRIENSDNNHTKEVVVEVYQDGRLHYTRVLPYPTTLFDFTLSDGVFLKVYERDFTNI